MFWAVVLILAFAWLISQNASALSGAMVVGNGLQGIGSTIIQSNFSAIIP